MSAKLPNSDPVISLCEKWWQEKRDFTIWSHTVHGPAEEATLNSAATKAEREAAEKAFEPIDKEHNERLDAWMRLAFHCANMPATTIRGVREKLRIIVEGTISGASNDEEDKLLVSALMDLDRLSALSMAEATQSVTKRPYVYADMSEENHWREMPFTAKGEKWTKIEVTDNRSPEALATYFAMHQIGAARAADMISHLRLYPFGSATRLTDVIESMTGTELGHIEHAFIEGLAEFIGSGQIAVGLNFNMMPDEWVGSPRPICDIDAEGDAQ